jgi:DNA-binding LacI/PurR family transcriptional regulator
MAKPTLAHVAAQAGVSQATASRVLNGRPGVSANARQAVITALDVLGYERPLALRHKSAGLVGLVMPELSNPIFPAFAQIFESLLAERGFTPVLCTRIVGGADEDEYVEMLLERGVAGIIFVSGMHADTTTDLERYRRLVEHGLPTVFIDGYRAGVEAPFVSTDDAEAITLAVDHLRSLGHRRIGLAVGQSRYVPSRDKITAFRSAIKPLEQDGDPDDFIAVTMYTVEGGNAAARHLVDRGVTGIVCASDIMALGVVRGARSRGLEVPRDVSVIGYDDSTLMAFTDPPLTTVRKPVAAMASAATAMLIEAVSGNPHVPENYLFSPELVVRASTTTAP